MSHPTTELILQHEFQLPTATRIDSMVYSVGVNISAFSTLKVYIVQDIESSNIVFKDQYDINN